MQSSRKQLSIVEYLTFYERATTALIENNHSPSEAGSKMSKLWLKCYLVPPKTILFDDSGSTKLKQEYGVTFSDFNAQWCDA